MAERTLDDALFVVCGLAWAAALIHLRAAGAQLDSDVPAAVLLGLLAAAQVAWGIATYRHPWRFARGGAVAGVLLAAGALLLRSWDRGAVGTPELLATVAEALIALLAGLRIRGEALPRIGHAVVVTAAVAVISLSSIAFVVGGHAH